MTRVLVCVCRCDALQYDADLPSVSVILPFYDEWPSILLRAVYSVVNRTPRPLLQQILLVDDHSTMGRPLGCYAAALRPC